MINLIIVMLNHQYFFIKSGYFGLMTNPRGDLSFACYYLLGCLGFSILCFYSIYFCYFFAGSDLFGILVNF